MHQHYQHRLMLSHHYKISSCCLMLIRLMERSNAPLPLCSDTRITIMFNATLDTPLPRCHRIIIVHNNNNRRLLRERRQQLLRNIPVRKLYYILLLSFIVVAKQELHQFFMAENCARSLVMAFVDIKSAPKLCIFGFC